MWHRVTCVHFPCTKSRFLFLNFSVRLIPGEWHHNAACLKDLLFFSSFAFCFSCPCPEWRDRRRGKEGEKWKGHEWWMLCVCLSFPITELCLLKRRSDAFLISAFLTDEEQTLTGGHCVFKKNCLTSHSVFTSDTIHRSGRSCSAAFLQHNFFFICIHSPVPFSNV